MSAVHCVVVWEWRCGAQWLPHAPGVARTLERAHGKALTRVVLADAEPALRGHYVNLRTLTQTADTPEGGTAQCAVRRACYSVQSPAGRGARWEWAPPARDPPYEPLPMETQCILEEAWAGGRDTVPLEGWLVSLQHMSARGGGALRVLRRAPQPPYPLARSPAAPAPAPAHPAGHTPAHTPVEGRRARIPQQHTGSSVHSVHSVHSAHSAHSAYSAHSAHSAHSAPSLQPPRKPGLARQILHNLNIFSNNNKPTPAVTSDKRQSEWQWEREKQRERESEQERGTDTECGSSRSGRRHSVDTVSTYLSHESKDSLQHLSAGSLLNCSAGSDDVFDCAPASAPAPRAPPPLPPLPAPPTTATDISVIGDLPVDSAEDAEVLSCVRAVACPQWGALCPACMRPLAHAAHADYTSLGGQSEYGGSGSHDGGHGGACVMLAGCQHMLHLRCLRAHLDALRANQEPLHIACLVCGRVYGRRAPPAPAPGPQPAGSMAWSRQPGALPAYPGTATILVTYNFQSGRQGARDPAPGAPYYAVGFPRHSALPDTPLGRQVLSALRGAWERRRLFTIGASQTTGREHVVAWRVAPPPERAQLGDAALRAALARLHALAAPADCAPC